MATRAILLEGDPQDLNEIPVYLNVEYTSEDCLTLWANRDAREGEEAHPGFELTFSQARQLATELKAALSGEGGSSDE
jgi:hypothetical protein